MDLTKLRQKGMKGQSSNCKSELDHISFRRNMEVQEEALQGTN